MKAPSIQLGINGRDCQIKVSALNVVEMKEIMGGKADSFKQ